MTLLDAGVIETRRGVEIPYRLGDGALHNWKVFPHSGRPKARWAWAGRHVIPFGLDLLPAGFAIGRTTVILAEGESDALALRDHYAVDQDGGPIIAIGLPGASSWQRSWTPYFLPARRVYVVGDGDPAGRRMIDHVLRDVPGARGVYLPEGDDARGFIQRDGKAAFDALLDEADRTAEQTRRLIATAQRLHPVGAWRRAA